MKKIFSIFAAVMFAASSYAAVPEFEDPAQTWTVGQTTQLDSWKWNSETKHGYAVINDDWYTFSIYAISKADPKASSPKQPWSSYTTKGTISNTAWPANGLFQGSAYYDATAKAATGNTARVYSYKVTNMSAVSLYANSGDSSRYFCLAVLEGGTLVAADSATNKVDTILTLRGFDIAKTYTVIAYGNAAENSTLYEIAFSISGEEPELDPKAVSPTFSVPSGEYYEPFKVGLTSSKADQIFYSLDSVNFVAYTDSIEISEYDKPYKIYAYAALANAANSDTITAEYLLSVFVPRTKFNARRVVTFAGIQASDIQILDPNSASIGSYEMDKEMCSTVNYKHQKTADQSQDSAMSISFAGREGVNFVYKNKEDKERMMICAPNFLVLNGSNFEMHLSDVLPGDTIVFVLTAKGATSPVFSHTYSTSANLNAYEPEDEEDPDYTDGEIYTKQDARIDDDYCGYSNLVYIVKASKRTAKLKETKGGFRLAEILIGAYRGEEPDWSQGVENVNVDVKAIKRVENGQLIIMKGDRKFNVLGAEIK